ncbi:uncharacterized protein LOC110861195 [Folsomia candida]|uniref:uncharacterized protein LOC110861195 n=1 Tax=Folsomia candida TaxID=158441 RepID=UPI000B9041D3|nr:uncharacterized protein LOC110861195 [Folsomia candida]
MDRKSDQAVVYKTFRPVNSPETEDDTRNRNSIYYDHLLTEALSSVPNITVSIAPVTTPPISASQPGSITDQSWVNSVSFDIFQTDGDRVLNGPRVLNAVATTANEANKSEPILRKIVFTRDGVQVLKCEYRCSLRYGFPEFRFSSPSSSISPVNWTSEAPLAPGMLGFVCSFLCPCFCLCFPTATTVLQNKKGQEKLLLGEEWIVVARKINIFRPASKTSPKTKVGHIHTSEFRKNQKLTITFDDGADSMNERLLIIGVAVGLLDKQYMVKLMA